MIFDYDDDFPIDEEISEDPYSEEPIISKLRKSYKNYSINEQIEDIDDYN